MTPRPDPGRDGGQSIEQVSRVVYDNPWMALREDVIRRADGSEGIYSYVEKPDFALIIPIERDGFHLVEQYRYQSPIDPGSFPRARYPTGRTVTRPNSKPASTPANTKNKACTDAGFPKPSSSR